MEERIKTQLNKQFSPAYLEIINESHLHAGHAGHQEVGGGNETHFRVIITSTAFAGQSRVAIHKQIYNALDACLKDGVHALAIEAKAA